MTYHDKELKWVPYITQKFSTTIKHINFFQSVTVKNNNLQATISLSLNRLPTLDLLRISSNLHSFLTHQQGATAELTMTYYIVQSTPCTQSDAQFNSELVQYVTCWDETPTLGHACL